MDCPLLQKPTNSDRLNSSSVEFILKHHIPELRGGRRHTTNTFILLERINYRHLLAPFRKCVWREGFKVNVANSYAIRKGPLLAFQKTTFIFRSLMNPKKKLFIFGYQLLDEILKLYLKAIKKKIVQTCAQLHEGNTSLIKKKTDKLLHFHQRLNLERKFTNSFPKYVLKFKQLSRSNLFSKVLFELCEMRTSCRWDFACQNRLCLHVISH